MHKIMSAICIEVSGLMWGGMLFKFGRITDYSEMFFIIFLISIRRT